MSGKATPDTMSKWCLESKTVWCGKVGGPLKRNCSDCDEDISEECFGVLEKRARAQSSGAAIYLPKTWVGKRIKAFLMEEPEV